MSFVIEKYKAIAVHVFLILIFVFSNSFAKDIGEIDWGSAKPENNNQTQSDKFRDLFFKPDYSDKTILKLIKEVVPLVEKHTDRKFRYEIKFELVDAPELDLVLKKEMIIQLRNFFPDETYETIERYAAVNSRVSTSLLGKYGFITKKLYFLPYQFRSILEHHNIKDEYHDNILKLVIAHELCHMVQDQEIDLKRKILSIKTQEEIIAYNALVEGHAMFIMGQVAKELDLHKTLSEFYKVFSVPDSLKSDGEITKVNKKKVNDLQQAYIGGEKFVSYHYERGGNKKVWSMFRFHPLNPGIIEQPEQYDSKDEVTKMNLKICLDFLPKIYNRNNGWVYRNVEFSKAQIEETYKDFEPEIKEKIVSNITHNRVFLAKKSDGTFYNVTILLLKKDLSGSKLIKYLEKLMNKNVKNNEEGKFQISNFKKEKIKFIDADSTSKVTMTVSYNDEYSTEFIAIRICDKELFIEITAMNHQATDEETKINIETIFKLYKQLKDEKDKGYDSSENMSISME